MLSEEAVCRCFGSRLDAWLSYGVANIDKEYLRCGELGTSGFCLRFDVSFSPHETLLDPDHYPIFRALTVPLHQSSLCIAHIGG